MSKEKKVLFILDRSGSMGTVRDETISGVNVYLDTLRNDLEYDYKLTFVQFDSQDSQEVLALDEGVRDVKDLSRATYVPRASTPLFDAIGHALSNAGDDPRVCVIVTDGEENASTEYTRQQITDMKKEKEDKGWSFVYIGADHDAFASGRNLGYSASNTVQFDKSKMGETMSFAAGATRDFAETGLNTGSVSRVAAKSGKTEDEYRKGLIK